MEVSTALAPATSKPKQHMIALAKAQRRVVEIAALKREICSGQITVADAVQDPRAVGAVTVGQLLIAQTGWGRARATEFMVFIGASESALAKRVESLTERQRGALIRAVAEPHAPLGPRAWW